MSKCDKRCRTSSEAIVRVEILEFVRTGTNGVGHSGSGTDFLLEKKDAITSALSLLLVATVPSDLHSGGISSSVVNPWCCLNVIHQVLVPTERQPSLVIRSSCQRR